LFLFLFLQLKSLFSDPPASVKINEESSGFAVIEGETLSLSCSAESKPISSFQWYFKGK